MTRYAIVRDGKVFGVVNHNGGADHLYGDVDLRGPVSDHATLEQLLGKRWDEVEAKPKVPDGFVVKDGDFGPLPDDVVVKIPSPDSGEDIWFSSPSTGRKYYRFEGGWFLLGKQGEFLELLDPLPPPDAPTDQPMTAADLIAAPSMPWFAFKAEAKRILGDAMPEKKEQVIEALKKIGNPA